MAYSGFIAVIYYHYNFYHRVFSLSDLLYIGLIMNEFLWEMKVCLPIDFFLLIFLLLGYEMLCL